MLNNKLLTASMCAKDHVEKETIGVSGFDVMKILISIHQLAIFMSLSAPGL